MQRRSRRGTAFRSSRRFIHRVAQNMRSRKFVVEDAQQDVEGEITYGGSRRTLIERDAL